MIYTFEVTDDCDNTATKSITVTRETNKVNCETAYAKLEGDYEVDATCFLNDGFDRWGWTNKITVNGEYILPLYAGAAQCDISKGTLVGEVKVNYAADGTVTVQYLITDPAYYMSEAHVYIGCNDYPKVKQGKKMVETVAPGQYTYNASGLDHVTDLTVTFTELSDGFYIIAHAVTCEIICACTNTDNSIGDPVVINSPIVINQYCGFSEKSADIPDVMMEASDLRAYPNPFSEKVTFEFVSGADAHAILELTNVLGQKVSTLLDEQVSKGVMNRVDYLPKDIISGIYYYRLILDGNVQTGKLIYRNK
jgi:hypothetical protein